MSIKNYKKNSTQKYTETHQLTHGNNSNTGT